MDLNNLARSQPQSPPADKKTIDLEFITFTDPQSAKSASNRQRIRRQAMRAYHKSSDAPKRPKNEIELDISSLVQRHQPEPEYDMTGLLNILDASRMDPFFNYPIEMGYRERELYTHFKVQDVNVDDVVCAVYDETCILFRTMRDIGFFNRIRPTAAFCQMLAISSWHLDHLNTSYLVNDHLKYSLKATQLLQEELDDSNKRTSDDAIGAVLAFVCCAFLIHDFVSYNVHLNGLSVMLQQRGGLHSLDSDIVLRMMLYWADTNAAYVQDSPLQFQPPTHLLPGPEYSQESLPSSVDGSRISIARFCAETRAVQCKMRTELRNKVLWRDTAFPSLHISPLFGELLSARSRVDETDTSALAFEAFRIAALLYVGALRGKFGNDTISADDLYIDKLQTLFSESGAYSTIPETFLIWILAVAFTAQRISSEHKTWARAALCTTLQYNGITSFEMLLGFLMEVVWDIELFEMQSQCLTELLASENLQE